MPSTEEHTVAVAHSGPALTSTHRVALEGSSNQFSHSFSRVTIFLALPLSSAAQRLVIPATPYWALAMCSYNPPNSHLELLL